MLPVLQESSGKTKEPISGFRRFSRRPMPCSSPSLSANHNDCQSSSFAIVGSFSSVMFSSYKLRSAFFNSILSSVSSPSSLLPSSSSSFVDQSETSSSTMKPCNCKLCCLVILALLAISASRATLETSKFFVVSPRRAILSADLVLTVLCDLVLLRASVEQDFRPHFRCRVGVANRLYLSLRNRTDSC